MKTKIIPSSELTTESLSPHYYIPDAFYSPDRKITFKVRNTNNVLDEEDWPIISITLLKERIVNLRVIQNSVCSLPGFVLGESLSSILKWLSYDGTGVHPECSHEIFDPISKKWLWVNKMEDLVSVLSNCHRHKHR